MLAYIQQFTNDHINTFWFPFPYTRTVCRMYIGLSNNNGVIFEVSRYSENSSSDHAEVVAYKEISRKLISELNKHEEYLNSKSQLDFAIATNNSSCNGCRKRITNWIKDLKKSINGTHLQLTLFFNNLYVGEEGSVDNVVVSFTNWIVDLVKEYDMVVDICPIVVNKMLPKQDYKFRLKDLSKVIKCDITCLENFRDLYAQLIAAKDGTFIVHCHNHDLFNSDKPVDSLYMEIFTWKEPMYISVCRSNEHSSSIFLPEPSTSLPEPSKIDLKSSIVQEKHKKVRKSSHYYNNNNKTSRGKPRYLSTFKYNRYRRRLPKRKPINFSKYNA